MSLAGNFKIKGSSKRDKYHGKYIQDKQNTYRLDYIQDGMYDVYSVYPDGTMKCVSSTPYENIENGVRNYDWIVKDQL